MGSTRGDQREPSTVEVLGAERRSSHLGQVSLLSSARAAVINTRSKSNLQKKGLVAPDTTGRLVTEESRAQMGTWGLELVQTVEEG